MQTILADMAADPAAPSAFVIGPTAAPLLWSIVLDEFAQLNRFRLQLLERFLV